MCEARAVHLENAFICTWSLTAYFTGKTIPFEHLLSREYGLLERALDWQLEGLNSRLGTLLTKRLQADYLISISLPSSTKWG